MPGTADDLSGQGIEPEADGRRRQINGVDGTQCLTWNGAADPAGCATRELCRAERAAA